MREITDHKVNGLNEALEVAAVDEPGSGGANHVYKIRGFQHRIDLAFDGKIVPGDYEASTVLLPFQNGPIQEAGFNGLSNESLIAVVIDRMRGFQSGQFASRENALALTNLEQALMWLQKRTRDRVARGVEGTPQK